MSPPGPGPPSGWRLPRHGTPSAPSGTTSNLQHFDLCQQYLTITVSIVQHTHQNKLIAYLHYCEKSGLLSSGDSVSAIPRHYCRHHSTLIKINALRFSLFIMQNLGCFLGDSLSQQYIIITGGIVQHTHQHQNKCTMICIVVQNLSCFPWGISVSAIPRHCCWHHSTFVKINAQWCKIWAAFLVEDFQVSLFQSQEQHCPATSVGHVTSSHTKKVFILFYHLWEYMIYIGFVRKTEKKCSSISHCTLYLTRVMVS